MPTRFGYTMMCEQSRPDQLVRDLQAAEAAGFDFSVISDHYAPWLDSQGHSGYACLYDLPDERVPIGIAVSGPDSCRLAGAHADAMIAVEPKAELGELFDAAGGAGKPRIGQVAVCWDRDREAAVRRAHEQFRWFGLGWKVNADLPHPAAFDGATRFVTPEQVGEAIACGPDVEEHVEAIRPYLDAGFGEVALVQIGAETQTDFCAWAERELLPALRAL